MTEDRSEANNGGPRTRILLVDDHKLMREGLRSLLNKQPGMVVVGEAGDGESTLRAVRAAPPDLVIMDVHLPDMTGIETARRILTIVPDLKVVVLSSDPSPARVHEALLAGISGYVLKENALTELVRAIESVVAGHLFLCPEVSTDVIESYRKGLLPRPPVRHSLLSAREVDVLKLIAEGLRTKEIADRLQISAKTVETYRQRLQEKLKVSSVAELTRYAVREGMVVA